MVMTDPIADMLTRIRNANKANLETVNIPHSNVKADLAKLLLDEGYVANVEVNGEGISKTIVVTLKSYRGEKVIKGIKRISKPGLRVYSTSDKLPKVLSGLGVAIISTSQGIMSDREARLKGLGGEVMAYV